jgi:simple sugar transport system ATP-binding protein
VIPAVSFQGVSRRFGAILANDEISFDVAPGSVHALLGENGAGKSTLLSILAGLLRADRGRILVHGAELRPGSPRSALELGVGLCAQHFLLAGALSGAENILLGRPGARGWRPLPGGRIRRIAREAEASGLTVPLDRPVGELPVASQEKVEILKILERDSRVLVLDEPTAVLAPPEVEPLFATLRRLANAGRTILLVTHKLGEVAGVADRVTVLRGGRVVGEGEVRTTPRETLLSWITGSESAPARTRTARRPGGVVLAARGASCGAGACGPSGYDLTVRAGEIVGLGGVLGNGQSEIVGALTGRLPLTAGEIELLGARVRAPAAVRLPDLVAWIPEDRREEGLALEMTLRENLAIGLPRARAPRGEAARRRLEEYGVSPADPDSRARHLSGGNQQRLLLARELSREARVLLAVHPTRGLDPRSTAFVRDRLLEARERGLGILLVTGDLDELCELSDRIQILYRGRVLYEASAEALDLAAMHRSLVGIEAA